MRSIEALQDELKELVPKPKLEKMTVFASLITEYLEEEGLRPVVVGGLSVELYSRGEYSTSDIDFVTPGYDIVGDLLEKLGFEKTGKNWYHRELEIAVEIPSNHLEGSPEKVIKFKLENNKHVYVIGAEDIIVHRLESALASFPENPEYSEDYEWARRLFLIHQDHLDIDYMRKQDALVTRLLDRWLRDKH
ncbi:nucleotidyltransferase [Salibacterium lacus]|uniref:Nucleotidyltransferase n=1 Tax=Salibacterium lacus TaxID=1898109 RepID=A0ABW5T7Z7_9BACI